MEKLKKGDRIKCSGKDDAVDTMCELAKSNIDTDFLYIGDEIWLEVIKDEA